MLNLPRNFSIFCTGMKFTGNLLTHGLCVSMYNHNSLIQNNYQNLLDSGIHPICHDLKKKLVWPLESVNFNEYKYDADVREGLKNKEKLVNPVFQITYDNDLLRTLRTEKGIGFFRQSFDFTKFPFDTQKLIIRLKK